MAVADIYLIADDDNFDIDWEIDDEGYLVIVIRNDASRFPDYAVHLQIPPDRFDATLAEIQRLSIDLSRYRRGDRGGPTPEMRKKIEEGRKR